MRRAMIVAVALACLAALGWGTVAWIDAEVDRRVAAEVRRRTILPPPWRRPAAEPRQPESIEDYTARVEWARQRLAVLGITDPSPHQIQMELMRGN